MCPCHTLRGASLNTYEMGDSPTYMSNQSTAHRGPGEGNGYPLQCFGQENSRDCVVHGIAENWTWLNDFHPTHPPAGVDHSAPTPRHSQPGSFSGPRWYRLGSQGLGRGTHSPAETSTSQGRAGTSESRGPCSQSTQQGALRWPESSPFWERSEGRATFPLPQVQLGPLLIVLSNRDPKRHMSIYMSSFFRKVLRT